MKKHFILLIAALFVTSTGFAQIFKNKTDAVKISFFSTTPVENISAESKGGASLINFNNDSIIFRVPIKSFHFPNSLMEEHFNENYMESGKYPFSTFVGKINQHIDYTKPGTHSVTATGTLDIHGVKQPRTINGTLTINADKTATLVSDFDVKLADHKIEVPQLVFQKIAETIQVKVNVAYEANKK